MKVIEDSYYENLLHSLLHEHTRDNIERHVLVFEKWCKTFSKGVFIKDLQQVVELITVLRDRYISHPDLFEEVVIQVLDVCSKPILESKANERLRLSGIDSIKSFYLALSQFLLLESTNLKMACTRTFRCISQGGVDPTVLQVDFIPTIVDGNVSQVTDKDYTQNLIRESGALDVVAVATKDIFENCSKKVSMRRDIEEGKIEGEVSEEAQAQLGDELELASRHMQLCLDLVGVPASATRMCKMGAGQAMIHCLVDESKEMSPNNERISQCIDLLWTFFDCLIDEVEREQQRLESVDEISGSAVDYVFNSCGAQNFLDFSAGILSLKRLLLYMLFHGFRHSQKEIRNEIVILLTLIHSFPVARVHFLNSGLIMELLTYACVGDVGASAWPFFSKSLAKLRNFSTVADIDLQFKKELWILLADMLTDNDEDVTACIASSPFLEVLLSYLEYNSLGSGIDEEGDEAPEGNLGDDASKLNFSSQLTEEEYLNQEASVAGLQASISVPQLREFQVIAIIILAKHAHRMMGEFARIKGPERVLSILCKYANSLHSDHKKIVYNSFLLLNSCLVSSNVMTEILEAKDAMRFFLYYFESSDDESAQAQCVRNITVMCSQSELSKKIFRESKGIIPIVKALNEFAKVRSPLVGKLARIKLAFNGDYDASSGANDDTGGDINLLVVSVLDCIWKAVIGNESNEESYAQALGIEALFDLLEVSPFLLRRMVLKLLCDLFLNFKLSSYAYAWRSHKTMRSIGQLLCHCWMDEEVRVGNIRDSDGVICNLWNILGAHVWPKIRGQIFWDDDSSIATNGTDKSSTVQKLSTAIMAARMGVYGKSLQKIRSHVFDSDLRGTVSMILQSLGFLEVPVVKEVTNDSWKTGENNIILDETVLEGRENISSKKSGYMRALSSQINMNGGTMGVISMMKPADYDDQNLSPSDKQVISIAMRYDTIREGEWWGLIEEQMRQMEVLPIDADANYLEDRRERLFEACRAIQFEQMELTVVRNEEKVAQANVFIDNLLMQKNQQIKSEWLKKKSGKKF